MKFLFLSHRQETKAQASLRVCSLTRAFAVHIYKVWIKVKVPTLSQKYRTLALLDNITSVECNGIACSSLTRGLEALYCVLE